MLSIAGYTLCHRAQYLDVCYCRGRDMEEDSFIGIVLYTSASYTRPHRHASQSHAHAVGSILSVSYSHSHHPSAWAILPRLDWLLACRSTLSFLEGDVSWGVVSEAGSIVPLEQKQENQRKPSSFGTKYSMVRQVTRLTTCYLDLRISW